MSAFSDCLAQETGDGDTLYVNPKSSNEAAKYLLDDINKMTFSNKGIQLWSTSWPTEYPYASVENLTFKDIKQTFDMGDVNNDGVVNVTDVMAVVNSILGNKQPSYHEKYADMNGDGIVDVIDAMAIVNVILSPNRVRGSFVAPRGILSQAARSQNESARQYLNIYQDAVVIKQIPTTEIDSIEVSETDPRYVSIWHGGNNILKYQYNEIDSVTITNRGGYPFSYTGIVGFNDDLYRKGIGILSTSTASQYKSFVNNLVLRDGTLLYYAVDNGLDMLDNANIVTPLKNVSLITFTDGLDQGSLMMTDQYGSSYEYLDAMSNRILGTSISGLPLNAFSVGLRGKDVTNVSLFRQNIERLASSPGNAFEVSSINDLREKLKTIADQIISVSNRQTISLKIPGIDSGTLVRFTFDGKSAENSQLYIEGTFNLSDRSLHNVSYHGIKATTGSNVQGTQNGIFVTYTFTGLRLETGSGLVPFSSIQHYYRLPSDASWQKNSEFNSANNTQTSVSHSGAVIFLLLDCSSSLGSDFSKMKQYANEFVDLIANNAEPYSLVTPQNVNAQMDENEWAVHVSWDAVRYAQSYNVYRSSSSSGTYQLVAENITSTEWTDESPLSGSNYYRVSAVCYGNASSQSSYAYVNVKLDAPTNVTAVMDDNEWAVDVSWDAVAHAEYYSVYRSSSSSSGFSKVADSLTVSSWRDNNPLNGNNYYRIYAMGHGLTSNASSTTDVIILGLCPDDNHPHLIDLGLPSGTKWACCNVGADKPEAYGGYYAWGETEEKDVYNWSTYIHCDGSSSSCHDLGSDIAGTQYDVAHVKWGGSWVMPTLDQIKELLNNCTSVLTTENGIKGRKFTGPNGRCLFLPAAGHRFYSDLYYAGSGGYYWSSTQYPSNAYSAYYLGFYSGYKEWNYDYRCSGRSVRPVVRN